MPLGANHGNSVRIDPARFAEVLKELQHDYAAIVMVGPSLLDYAEGLIHAAQLDQLLLTVGGGKSHWNELAKAEQAALRAGLCCFGTAVNCEHHCQTIQLTAFDADSQQRQHISNDESSDSDIRNDLSAIENEIRQAMTEQSQLPQVDAI